MAHQDKENYTVILNSKNRIGNEFSSTNDANYYFDWGVMPEGEYKMTYSLCKQLYVSPLSTLLAAKPAWAIYDAKNFNSATQQLIDSSTNGRHATCTGCTLFSASGDGATAFIPNVIGSGTSSILFPVGSIPPNFTMFALSRYLDSGGKRILSGTGENGPLGNFILGHFSQQFPQVYNYSQFLASRNTTPMTNFCNIGFSSASTSPNNVIFNGVGIGTGNRDSTGVVNARLCVNLFQPFGTGQIIEQSRFALSQLIIWDRELTTDEMKIVSASFTNYLENGFY
jgi:hypothetical protein